MGRWRIALLQIRASDLQGSECADSWKRKSRMFEHILKHIVSHLWQEAAQAGVRKVSELSGRKAKAAAAAAQSLEDFISLVKKGALGLAASRCTAGLQKELGRDGLQKFFSDLNMTSAAWELKAVDDSSEDHWGTLWQVTFSGSLVGCKLRGRRRKVDAPLRFIMAREDDWKVQAITLFETPSAS